MCRCGRLRTLVLAMDDWPTEGLGYTGCRFTDLTAQLPSLALGAPGLRALQLVLPMRDGEDDLEEEDLEYLWRGLEALPNLASLALGWVFLKSDHTGCIVERIASAGRRAGGSCRIVVSAPL